MIWSMLLVCPTVEALVAPATMVQATDALKSSLLEAIAKERQGSGSVEAIWTACQRLEDAAPAPGPISGRWSLVFSTMSDKQMGLDLTDAVYKRIFKWLPSLAGGAERELNVRNEQLVDLDAGIVDNIVVIKLPSFSVRLRVRGTAAVQSPSSVAIAFESLQIAIPSTPFDLTLPLPRPRGAIRTTFVDDNLRVSRGSRGGLFVLRRLPA